MNGNPEIKENDLQTSAHVQRSLTEISQPVLDKMHQYIETWKSADDKRHFFLSCYVTMTGNMVRAIEACEFRDPIWVSKLLERFADYYFEGLERCECGAPDRPLVWEYAHRTTQQCDIHVIQYILLGINAHINYDLVLTLHEILSQEWNLANEELKSMRRLDHEHVNEIIARSVDTVQDQIIELQSPIMDVIDKVMGRADEYLLSQLIKSWRNDVWEEAVAILDANDPGFAMQRIRQLEGKVQSIAERILLR